MNTAKKDIESTPDVGAVGIESTALFACGNCKDKGVYLNYPELKDMPSFCWCKAGRTALRRRRIEYLKNKEANEPVQPRKAGE